MDYKHFYTLYIYHKNWLQKKKTSFNKKVVIGSRGIWRWNFMILKSTADILLLCEKEKKVMNFKRGI